MVYHGFSLPGLIFLQLEQLEKKPGRTSFHVAFMAGDRAGIAWTFRGLASRSPPTSRRRSGNSPDAYAAPRRSGARGLGLSARQAKAASDQREIDWSFRFVLAAGCCEKYILVSEST